MINLKKIIKLNNLSKFVFFNKSKYLPQPQQLNRSISINTKHYGAIKLAYNSYENSENLDNNDPSPSPIVIMHGLFGSKQNWKSISKAIHAKSKPQRKVIALDARNHGDSPHLDSHSYEDLADDVMDFFQQHNIKKSIVIGHSMGGRAMMCLALKFPEYVEKAVIIDISPVTHNPSLQKMISLIETLTTIQIPNELSMSAGRKYANEQLMINVPEKATRDFILMNLSKNDCGTYKWRINVNALLNNYDNISKFPENYLQKQYTGSVLFIGGSQSDYLNQDDLPKIHKLFPNAKLQYIDSGHLVHVEKPNEFLEKVLTFINH